MMEQTRVRIDIW